MGEFRKTYDIPMGTNAEAEAAMSQRIVSEAINSGFTPDGEPFISWAGITANVMLPVTERTQDGH